MRLNRIISILVLSFFSVAQAIDCDLAKLIAKPELASNAKFWEELGQIDQKNRRSIQSFIEKYSEKEILKNPITTVERVTAAIKIQVDTTREADKAIAKLNQNAKKHYDEFLKIVNEEGPQALHKNQNRWRYKKIPEVNSKTHSVKLDTGGRVLFEVDGNSVRILDVGNHVTH